MNSFKFTRHNYNWDTNSMNKKENVGRKQNETTK